MNVNTAALARRELVGELVTEGEGRIALVDDSYIVYTCCSHADGMTGLWPGDLRGGWVHDLMVVDQMQWWCRGQIY